MCVCTLKWWWITEVIRIGNVTSKWKEDNTWHKETCWSKEESIKQWGEEIIG